VTDPISSDRAELCRHALLVSVPTGRVLGGMQERLELSRWVAVVACGVVACSSTSNPSAAHDAAVGVDGGKHASVEAGTHDSGRQSTDSGSDSAPDAAATCANVTTLGGPVQGVGSGATCAYEGIPYAAPPTGNLRWRSPQPAATWTTPRPSALAPGCPQGSSSFGDASATEDCLYLNVWKPAAKSDAGPGLPVMVFVHGGSFEYGSGSYPLYDGTHLATTTQNLVVTINYRLGALGFLSNPALRAEDASYPSAGNYGISDQIAAFQWVKSNIAAFGGDPSNVTIFGESAGGTSMLVHLASPKSQGLFQHVMIESAYAPNSEGAGPQAAADEVGASFATALSCGGGDAGTTLLSCLRGQSVSDILAAADSLTSTGLPFNWFPIVDGFVLPDYPVKLITAGTFNKVPTLLGTNLNEATVLLVSSGAPTDPASYLAAASLSFPGNGAAVVAQYPISAYGGSYTNAAAQALTDGAFICPARQIARAIVAAGQPVYRYDFVHAIQFLIPNLGAFHGSELPFVFGNPLNIGTPLKTDELPLSLAMMEYWGAMAAVGNPNGGGRLAWPPYQPATEPDIVLDLALSTETELEQQACNFWQGLP